MSNNVIADYTDGELAAMRQLLTQRFRVAPNIDLADSELRLDPTSTELVSCPTAVWTHEGVTFLVFKTGDSRYRCLFYLGPNEQFGTGVEQYDDLNTCVMTLLQVQADYERDNLTKMDKILR